MQIYGIYFVLYIDGIVQELRVSIASHLWPNARLKYLLHFVLVQDYNVSFTIYVQLNGRLWYFHSIISMAKCKTAVSPLLMCQRYSSLALSAYECPGMSSQSWLKRAPIFLMSSCHGRSHETLTPCRCSVLWCQVDIKDSEYTACLTGKSAGNRAG